jgi:hypothetical protein
MCSMAVGDVRLSARGDWLMDRIVSTGSLVVRRIGGDRAGEIACHRFLDNARVEAQTLIDALSWRTSAACAGRRVLAVQDTTEVNFSGRDRGRRGLGPAGDGKALGFFIHPVVAVDAEDEAVLGLVDAEIWTRDGEDKVARRQRRFEDKESRRWLDGASSAAARLGAARQVVVVGDRESDIYPVFARRPDDVELIVRLAQNRSLASGARVFDAPLAARGEIEVAVGAKPGHKARRARLRLGAATLEVARPRNGAESEDPESLTLNMVETEEIAPPPGAKPLHWRLYTTLPVDSAEAAAEVVRLYRLRWRIEEVFRVLKSDGLKLEDTQVTSAERLFKLAALGLGAATRLIQLTDARDGGSRPATDVVDTELIEPIAAIGETLEGNTERQKNHHPKGTLAWLAWVTARLGGWNCYYKPPGPKTMATGWQQLAAMLQGYVMAQQTMPREREDV